MKAYFTALVFLLTASLANAGTFTCPTQADPLSVDELGYDDALKAMMSPMQKDLVWGSGGSDRSPIVFTDNVGSFKIGYDYRAKECERQIILEQELSPGLWMGKTLVNICAPKVAALFEGATDFESEVWPKIEAMIAQIQAGVDQVNTQVDACYEEGSQIYAKASEKSVKLQSFTDDVNGNGVVDGNDYEDTNNNGVADEGDRGVVDGQTYNQVFEEMNQLSAQADAHMESCYAISDSVFDLRSKITSLQGLQITDQNRDKVTYSKDDDGKILPQFAVPLTSFYYKRIIVSSTKQDSNGYYLFKDPNGFEAVTEPTKSCQMEIQHLLAYGGLALEYKWDFSYQRAYSAKTWSYNDDGESVQDPVSYTNDVDAFDFLDWDADDFVNLTNN